MKLTRPEMMGLVLAGGASTRMGTDKARMDWNGRPLLVVVAEELAGVCGEVLVASGDGRRLADLGYSEVADAVTDAGPLGGLVAGLEAANTPLVAVVAVDMPQASGAVLRRLAGVWDGEAAVIPEVAGRLEPLHAVWAAAAAPALRLLLAAGHLSVTAAARSVRARVAGPDVWGLGDQSGAFARNLNTPADLP